MTPQEAYNKGLDAAENIAVLKLSNAIIGNDDGPFNNPQMEEIRQQILNRSTNNDGSFEQIIDFLMERDVDLEVLSEKDKLIVKLLTYCRNLVKPTSRSLISAKTKDFLSKITVDLINSRDKLS